MSPTKSSRLFSRVKKRVSSLLRTVLPSRASRPHQRFTVVVSEEDFSCGTSSYTTVEDSEPPEQEAIVSELPTPPQIQRFRVRRPRADVEYSASPYRSPSASAGSRPGRRRNAQCFADAPSNLSTISPAVSEDKADLSSLSDPAEINTSSIPSLHLSSGNTEQNTLNNEIGRTPGSAQAFAFAVNEDHTSDNRPWDDFSSDEFNDADAPVYQGNGVYQLIDGSHHGINELPARPGEAYSPPYRPNSPMLAEVVPSPLPALLRPKISPEDAVDNATLAMVGASSETQQAITDLVDQARVYFHNAEVHRRQAIRAEEREAMAVTLVAERDAEIQWLQDRLRNPQDWTPPRPDRRLSL
ncbi:hypothetical protein G647_05566 [Cladophialophora carrionii CBS 160.54]|uniref:Uncharacterized protein n=1 Tax=Cladophialophora carrionii CBS 160.54 TaxID=1279043 RepID=V9DA86_9EURO|nr:uncharacterized protein G647_05566 [Cladophialophora carrionii CBS 160.54]ETI23760.1 hypothetical protein G647_05566 [Cladophialophora carrionii CBS 160.54]